MQLRYLMWMHFKTKQTKQRGYLGFPIISANNVLSSPFIDIFRKPEMHISNQTLLMANTASILYSCADAVLYWSSDVSVSPWVFEALWGRVLEISWLAKGKKVENFERYILYHSESVKMKKESASGMITSSSTCPLSLFLKFNKALKFTCCPCPIIVLQYSYKWGCLISNNAFTKLPTVAVLF